MIGEFYVRNCGCCGGVIAACILHLPVISSESGKLNFWANIMSIFMHLYLVAYNLISYTYIFYIPDMFRQNFSINTFKEKKWTSS